MHTKTQSSQSHNRPELWTKQGGNHHLPLGQLFSFGSPTPTFARGFIGMAPPYLVVAVRRGEGARYLSLHILWICGEGKWTVQMLNFLFNNQNFLNYWNFIVELKLKIKIKPNSTISDFCEFFFSYYFFNFCSYFFYFQKIVHFLNYSLKHSNF